jgi:hypothetical protein
MVAAMNVVIRPEPLDPERKAIEAALAALLGPRTLPPQYSSEWRQVGLREAVGAQAVARPRTSFGATRA